MTPHHFSKKKLSQEKITKSGGGFTLVEILVAVTIFVTVITVVSSLFVQAIRGQRRNLAYQELLGQTSYVMEYMSRSIRMAMKDDVEILGFLPKDCLGVPNDKINYEVVGSCLRFRDYKDQCHEFCLVPDGGKNKLVEIINGGSPVDLTSTSSLDVSLLPPNPSWVALTGEGQGDSLQPLVAISLSIEGREEAEIEIQTSVSQRNLDVTK
jgi:type II secretory pathway pseudopilin PulG